MRVMMVQVGLIGQPLGHSRSPAMQQAAFDALGIPARYTLWETAPNELAARVATLRDPGMLGANVTIPYKTAVLPLLDELDATARLAGAVNTIVRVGDESSGHQMQGQARVRARLVGHNTDVAGLRRALAEADAWRGAAAVDRRRVLLLGAGGAARAVLAVARLEGAAVTVAARRVDAAREVLAPWPRRGEAGLAATGNERGGKGTENAKDAEVRGGRGEAQIFTSEETEETEERAEGETERATADDAKASDVRPLPASDEVIVLDDMSRLAEALAETTLLVNATPVGMSDPDAAPIPLEMLARLPAGACVFDLVYSPPETALVRAAKSRGLRASGGLAMLLYQGVEAFTLWTGEPAPIAVMRAALEAGG